ncbi:tetratricopeptide repeat protein [Streptomyces iakyrus]|uniref:tetratricopeptide repeat protein n=1 Tax=Streptomyces iakyrus TaxID=68219 RepID=UPI003D8AB00E
MARHLKPVLLTGAAALIVALPGIVAAAEWNVPWLAALSVALAAVVAVFATYWQDTLVQRLQRDQETANFVREGCLTTKGALPVVRQVVEPTWLGVHAARRATGRAATVQPPYVPRDIDGELREHLAAAGAFVLIVGDSTAGKSRAAYEALTATLSHHTLVAPQQRSALPYAIEQTADTPRAVLWLDDLERFLGDGGLSRNLLTRFLDSGSQHRVVLATIRASELDTYLRTDNASRPLNRDVLDTLALAHRIDLPRLFSAAERSRAATRTWDPRISAALNQSDRFGIAEYLSAGPELLHLWHAARDGGDHVRGAALVSAAVDCRRAGVTAPLPRSALEELAVHYMPNRGGTPYQGEDPVRAWEWATEVRTTTALLTPLDADSFDVYDYLVDETTRTATPVSDTVLTAVLGFADAADAMRIGTIARAHGKYATALRAYEGVRNARIASLGEDAPDTLTSRGNYAAVLRLLGRLQEAETEHRAVLGARLRVLGVDDPATLVSRNNLALVLHDLDKLEEAEAQHRIVSDLRKRDLGEDHPATLTNRNNHAFVLHDLGQVAAAEAEHCAVLQAYQQLLVTAETELTAGSPNTAAVLRSLGRLEDAEAEHRTVLDTSTRVFDPDHPDALTSRGSPTLVLHAVERLDEAELMHRSVYEGYSRVLGADHPSTLTSRENLAVVLHARGKVTEAEREHRAVVEGFARVLGPEHPSTLTSRSNLAVVLQALGRTGEAEQEHRAVVDDFSRVLGPDHPSTLTSRNYLAALLLSLHRTTQAETEQRAVLEGFQRVLGPEHSSTLTSRGNLGVVLHALGRHTEAEAEHRAVLESFTALRGPLHPSTLTSRSNHAATLQSLGRTAEAEAEHRAVLEGFERVLGPDHPRTTRARAMLRRGQR